MAITFIIDSNGNVIKLDVMGEYVPTHGVTRPIKPVKAPWPGHNYLILEDETRRALGASGNRLVLVSGEWGVAPANIVWHCVDNHGFYSFKNLANKHFLCHDGNGRMRFAEADPRGPVPCEMIMPRPHPEGGIQLMVPEDWTKLRPIVVEKLTDRVVVPKEQTPFTGEGVWHFMKVDDYIPAPDKLD